METISRNNSRDRLLSFLDEHRLLLLVLVGAVALLALTLVSGSEDVEAWSYSTDYVSVGDYTFGGAGTSGGNYYKFQVTGLNLVVADPTVTRYTAAKTSSTQRSYVSIYIGDWDERTYVPYDSSYRSYLYLHTYSSVSARFDAVMIRGDVVNMEARQLYDSIAGGIYLGSYITNGHDRHQIYFSSGAISYIRTAVARGDDFLHIGFYATSGTVYVGAGYLVNAMWTYSHSLIYYDGSAPDPPTLNASSAYTPSTSVTVRYSIPSDLPSAPNRGVRDCEMGAFLGPSSVTPAYTRGYWNTGYTSMTFTGLTDGQTYYFRGRARDGSLFESGWGTNVSTTIDLSPPTVPVMEPEPMYTSGDVNIVEWGISTDAGVGGVTYQIQVSTRSDFMGASTHSTSSTQYSFSRLVSGATYYYRVRSLDSFNYSSDWSVPQSTTLDATAPTVPVMMAEPIHTRGTENTFNWHPSTDEGIGVASYRVQVATGPSFLLSDIFTETTTTGTSIPVQGLTDGRAYYARAMAVDAFAYGSAWSTAVYSIQDAIGPGIAGIDPLPMYQMEGPVELSWAGAIDAGSGTGWYRAEWSLDEAFPPFSMYQDHVLGHSFVVQHLDINETWFFRVTPYDNLGNRGTSSIVNTTIDGIPPNATAVDALPQYTKASEMILSWSAVEDDLSGVDHYTVHVFAAAGRGLVFSDTTNAMTLSMTVPGLSNGAMYWFQVIAVDVAGNANASEMETTTMDAIAPTIPQMEVLPSFIKGTALSVRWMPSTDAGLGGVEYMLEWATDASFATVAGSSPWLSATSYAVTDLDDGETHWFRVTARDGGGHETIPSQPVMTTIDATGPSEAVVDELAEYTAGTGLEVTWTDGTDEGIGGVTFRLVVYSDAMLRIPVHSSEWTNAGEAMVYGLADGATYWFVVEGRDAFLIGGEVSDPASTTMDASAPVVAADAGLFGPSGDVTGTCTDASSGVESVEASSDGTNWVDATVSGGTWTVAMADLPDGKVWVRATDKVGNVAAAHVLAMVDSTKPDVTIGSPDEGDDVSSAVVISGSVSDANLRSYKVEYQKAGGSSWTVVQPDQTTAGVNGILATWLTADLSGGDYKIRVTADDEVGLEGTATVSVTVKGARLSIGATDISFSDTHPLPDDMVTVMVTVRNTGDSRAEGVTVTVYDNGKAVGEESGVTVPAHGTATVAVNVKAREGSQVFTARATSTLYDTGEMDAGQPLKTIEEEAALENVGGILGLLALFIALIALILVIMGRMGGKEELELVEEEPEQVILDPIVEDLSFEERPPQDE